MFEVINGNLMLKPEIRERVVELCTEPHVAGMGTPRFHAVEFLFRRFQLIGIPHPLVMSTRIVDSIIQHNQE